jgi:agmatine deiminase
MKAPPTPAAGGYRQPAEWEPHRATWLAWPSHADLWGEALGEVRASFVELCRALSGSQDHDGGGGEALEVLVPDEDNERLAGDALAGTGARLHRVAFGDIWMRDIAPIFVRGPAGVAAVRFAFNGWGGKYQLPGDDQVAARVAERAGLPAFSFHQVLEGGALDTDGDGTFLTTRQCLLNANRAAQPSEASMEAVLAVALGARAVLWLDRGLENDHTDGHVDTLARFVRPGSVVCMRPSPGDPNEAALSVIARDLGEMRDAAGRRLEVLQIPSPGLIEGQDGRPMPASYVNFYIGNRAVVVPTYGSPHDDAAVAALAALFPGRRTVGVAARALLGGGGAFHCITQQEPAPAAEAT